MVCQSDCEEGIKLVTISHEYRLKRIELMRAGRSGGVGGGGEYM